MLPILFLVLFVLLSAIVIWLAYGRRNTRFAADFARLLESARSVDGFGDWIAGRAAVRKVAIVLRDGEDQPSTLVIAMATNAAPKMDTYDFAGYKADRDGEVAAFALEVKHGLKLRHVEDSLKAVHHSLPGSFDPSKWQSVLEAMDALCGSMERRGVLPPS
jgi:hypothetical protein